MFDWKDFLKLAQILSDTNQSFRDIEEAAKRTAVSRTYYVVYCSLRDFAERDLFFQSEERAADHKRLVRYLQHLAKNMGKNYKKKFFKVAETLHELRVNRNMCDYEVDVQNLDVIVSDSLEVVQKVFEVISGVEEKIDSRIKERIRLLSEKFEENSKSVDKFERKSNIHPDSLS
ncbi:MAG: hypothetical protein HPY87_06325 [Fervidobacterium sp.]|uniref:hypothetical protein n=1 Tax=Fervidobacterium TaxID=2422 RepID=UPI00143695BE|nr:MULTISPECIES: hypothetical protein [Fervidobacterium]NPU89495.1 hypothetical protein [Fervidobacterium sp.]QIV77648.1 hypothetical protein HER11_00595 [Fervidobacterium pennivorans subsp. keratinolyticus]